MPDDQFEVAAQSALQKVRGQMLIAAEQANRAIVARHNPVSVTRVIGGVVGAADAAYTAYQLVRLANMVARQAPRIEYRYSYMQEIVAFALATLREHSPVGAAGDKHAGQYRDSHLVFLNGHAVADVDGFRPGDVIHISNPVPYSRKIELGKMRLSVAPHVYEQAAQLVASRFGNQASVKFVFMPVRIGGVAAYAAASPRARPGRHMSDQATRDWLSRQPALEIKAR